MSQKGPIQSRLLPTHTERLLRTPPYFREASGYRASPRTGTNATRLSAYTQFLASGLRMAHHTHDAR
jgi:hypothetical protein